MLVWRYEGLAVSHRWVYLVGPMAWGVLASLVYDVQKIEA
jgi:glycerol uptake facilitator-like aquaporin